jgi:hypothetical protein
MYISNEIDQSIFNQQTFTKLFQYIQQAESAEVSKCLPSQSRHRSSPSKHQMNHNSPTSTTMSETTINGSCLCKGIHFTVTGQDKGAVLCHCNNCKSFAGSAYAHNYRMMKTKIEYQRGQELVRSYKDGATKSGKVLERFFCSRCVCRYDFFKLFIGI